ncbi:MAG: transposase, partial [Polyangiaceae bacterium]
AAFAALSLQGMPVAVVNPRSTKHFAQATNRLAKTDQVDAACLNAMIRDSRPWAATNP